MVRVLREKKIVQLLIGISRLSFQLIREIIPLLIIKFQSQFLMPVGQLCIDTTLEGYSAEPFSSATLPPGCILTSPKLFQQVLAKATGVISYFLPE